MNNEIKEILDFKEDADYKRLSVDEITMLRDYITKLKSKIEAYELFDNQKIANLQEENERLRNQLQQKENIIKEVREYIKDKYDYVLGDDTFLDHDERIDSKQIKHILEILDKEKA